MLNKRILIFLLSIVCLSCYTPIFATTTDNLGDMRLLWVNNHSLDEELLGSFSPTVVFDTPFTIDKHGTIYQYDKNTGDIVDKIKTKIPTSAGLVSLSLNSTSDIRHTYLFFASMHGRLIAVSLADKKVIWSYDLGSIVLDRLKIHHGILFAMTNNGRLFAFNVLDELKMDNLFAIDHSPMWIHNENYSDNAIVASSDFFSFEIYENLVLIGSNISNLITALDIQTGNVLFKKTIDKNNFNLLLDDTSGGLSRLKDTTMIAKSNYQNYNYNFNYTIGAPNVIAKGRVFCALDFDYGFGCKQIKYNQQRYNSELDVSHIIDRQDEMIVTGFDVEIMNNELLKSNDQIIKIFSFDINSSMIYLLSKNGAVYCFRAIENNNDPSNKTINKLSASADNKTSSDKLESQVNHMQSNASNFSMNLIWKNNQFMANKIRNILHIGGDKLFLFGSDGYVFVADRNNGKITESKKIFDNFSFDEKDDLQVENYFKMTNLRMRCVNYKSLGLFSDSRCKNTTQDRYTQINRTWKNIIDNNLNERKQANYILLQNKHGHLALLEVN